MPEFTHPVFKSFLDYYRTVLQWTDPANPNFGKVTPTLKYTGMLVYADGVAWDPGSGAGYYRWDGAAWIYIG